MPKPMRERTPEELAAIARRRWRAMLRWVTTRLTEDFRGNDDLRVVEVTVKYVEQRDGAEHLGSFTINVNQ